MFTKFYVTICKSNFNLHKSVQYQTGTGIELITHLSVTRHLRSEFSTRISSGTTLTCKALLFHLVQDIPDVKASEIMKDYSVYELLVGPPRPGDVIAYKASIYDVNSYHHI